MAETLVAAVQYRLYPLQSKQDFWRRIKKQVQVAQKRGARLLVFPEYLTAHLLALVPPMDHAAACSYLHELTGEYLTQFTLLSQATGMVILGGTHIMREGEGFFNTAFLFFPDGRVERQQKVHLTPEERNVWALDPGNAFAVFDTPAGKAAILICYDIEFPEAARLVADLGAQVILCPSYTDGSAGYYRVRRCCQARAIENQLYVVLSGMVGTLPQVPQIDTGFCQAGIFAPCDIPFPPNGILASGRTNRGMLICHQLDIALLEENRHRGQVAPYFDRRPEVYARYTGGQGKANCEG